MLRHNDQMATQQKKHRVTKMTRTQLNEMINVMVDQKICNYIVESQGIKLDKEMQHINESAKDGFKALKQACKNTAVKGAIFAATKSLQGAVNLLDGEAKTDMQSIVNVLMVLSAGQTGQDPYKDAYPNGVQNNQQQGGQVQQTQQQPVQQPTKQAA